MISINKTSYNQGISQNWNKTERLYSTSKDTEKLSRSFESLLEKPNSQQKTNLQVDSSPNDSAINNQSTDQFSPTLTHQQVITLLKTDPQINKNRPTEKNADEPVEKKSPNLSNISSPDRSISDKKAETKVKNKQEVGFNRSSTITNKVLNNESKNSLQKSGGDFNYDAGSGVASYTENGTTTFFFTRVNSEQATSINIPGTSDRPGFTIDLPSRPSDNYGRHVFSSNRGISYSEQSRQNSLNQQHEAEIQRAEWNARNDIRLQENRDRNDADDAQRQADSDRRDIEHQEMLSNAASQDAWEFNLYQDTLASLSEQDKITLESMEQYPELKFNARFKNGDIQLRLGNIVVLKNPVNSETNGPSLVPFNALTDIFNPHLAIPKNSQIIPKPGETLENIAQNSFTSVKRLLELNPDITDKDKLNPNLRINLPAGAVASKELSDRVISSSNLGGMNSLGYTQIVFQEDQAQLWVDKVFQDFSLNEISEIILGFNPGISNLDQLKQGDLINLPAPAFGNNPLPSSLLNSVIDPLTDGSTSIGNIPAERVTTLNNRINDLKGPSLTAEELEEIKYIKDSLVHETWNVNLGTKLEVQEGDTLTWLAKELGVSDSVTLDVLRGYNPQIADLSQIKAGDEIYIPNDVLAALPDASSVFDRVIDPLSDGSEAIGNLSPDRVAELNTRLDDVNGPPLTPTELTEINHINRHLNHDTSNRWVADTGAMFTFKPEYNLELLASEWGVSQEVAQQTLLDYNPQINELDQIKEGDSINVPFDMVANLPETSTIRNIISQDTVQSILADFPQQLDFTNIKDQDKQFYQQATQGLVSAAFSDMGLESEVITATTAATYDSTWLGRPIPARLPESQPSQGEPIAGLKDFLKDFGSFAIKKLISHGAHYLYSPLAGPADQWTALPVIEDETNNERVNIALRYNPSETNAHIMRMEDGEWQDTGILTGIETRDDKGNPLYFEALTPGQRDLLLNPLVSPASQIPTPSPDESGFVSVPQTGSDTSGDQVITTNPSYTNEIPDDLPDTSIVNQSPINHELIDQLSEQGIKHTPENIIAIEQVSDGRIVFLETGDNRRGFQHILNEHKQDFLNKGITATQIPSVLMAAITQGKIIGIQRDREIYEYQFNGATQHVAISIGSNGYIVGANPAPTPKDN